MDGGEGAVRDLHLAEFAQRFAPDFKDRGPDHPCMGNGQDRSRSCGGVLEEGAYAALKIGKGLPTRRSHLVGGLFPAAQQLGPPRLDLCLLQAFPVAVAHLHQPLIRGDG